MKKISVLLVALMLLTTLLAIPADAASITVKKGSPKIDGKLESLWADGPKLTIEEGGANLNCTVTDETYANVLWDDEYLYIGVEVHDTDISDYSGIVVFATFGDPTRPGCYVMETFTIDCTGEIVSDSTDSGSTYVAHDINMSYAAASADPDNDVYTIEFALSLKDIQPGVVFGLHVQVSQDIDNSGEYVLLTCDEFTFFDHVYKLIRTKAKAEDTTAAEGDTTTVPSGDVTTAPNAGTTTAAPSDNKSGCGSVLGGAGLVTMLAIACVPVIAARKKK